MDAKQEFLRKNKAILKLSAVSLLCGDIAQEFESADDQELDSISLKAERIESYVNDLIKDIRTYQYE